MSELYYIQEKIRQATYENMQIRIANTSFIFNFLFITIPVKTINSLL